MGQSNEKTYSSSSSVYFNNKDFNIIIDNYIYLIILNYYLDLIY